MKAPKRKVLGRDGLRVEGIEVLKNAFVVFVVAWLAFAFGSEARSEDIRGLKLNQSIVGLLASEPSLAENVLEIANTIDHTDGLRALPIIGRGSLQSINDLLFWCGVSSAALLDGRIDAAVFTGADAYTLLNSIKAKSGLAFSVQAAGSR